MKMYEFTSERKMMSILVKRLSDGKLLLFVKGADGKLLPNASRASS
jgi:magnesium-transporting ATPase (P-type)